jgi:hypothetical protein
MPCWMGVESWIGMVPVGCQLVAIELCNGASNLMEFQHPSQAVYVFGPEDGSVPQELLDKCHHKVYIPTEYSLNVTTTIATVLYDRKLKEKNLVDSNIKCVHCGHSHFRSDDGINYHCNACGKDWVLTKTET